MLNQKFVPETLLDHGATLTCDVQFGAEGNKAVALALNDGRKLPNLFHPIPASPHRQFLDHTVKHRLGAVAHLVAGQGLDGVFDENHVERRQAQHVGD